jgi:HSP20 family protein
MAGRDPRSWMMSEALNALARAESMQRRFFELATGPDAARPCWEPPVDVLETEREILVFIALPGVDPDNVEVLIEGEALVVRGRRVLPPELRQAVIHRLELPQGRFERRVALPTGKYTVRTRAADGCLILTLEKTEATP